MTDPRIVYGARCVWWDSIDKVATNPSGLPCCPYCGGVLFEVENELVWWTNVDKYADQSGDTDYRAFIEWLRGKCLPSLAVARLGFNVEKTLRAAAEGAHGH